jgi:hypothetical protein
VRILSFFSSSRALILFLRPLFLIFLILFAVAAGVPFSRAQTPEDAARGLARRVMEIRELPEKVAVEWTNVSSLPESESIILREAFLKELSSRHQVVATTASVAVLWVSVRETPTNLLLVARIASADSERVRMTDVPRTAFLPVMTRGNGLRLTKQLLWQQSETILDAREFTESPVAATSVGATNEAATKVTDIFVLKLDALVIYRDGGQRLNEIQELPFSGYKYVSRGLDGEMRRSKDGNVAVTLPGLNCSIHGPGNAGERWGMQCAAAATGAPTTADGEVPTLSSSCDATSWRLIGEATDWTRPDRLLLVDAEMKREEAVAALDFAGPVRRLAGSEDGKSALAVVFDLSSGSYEIYRVTMVCGR